MPFWIFVRSRVKLRTMPKNTGSATPASASRSATNRVAVRVVMSGTHLNEYRGIPPTGRPFTISQIVLCRMVDGKIAESWQEIDAKGLMLQFGIVPSVDGGTLRLLSWFTGLPVTFATAPRRIQRRKRELADSGGVRR